MSSSQLIISTGDISDVDGFLSITEYSMKTQSDLLFIMNYPAFLGVDYDKENDETDEFKGFNYGLKQILKTSFGLLDPNEYKNNRNENISYDEWLANKYGLTSNKKYIQIMQSFGITKDNLDDEINLKKYTEALTKISAYLVKTIFFEGNNYNKTQKLFFMIGDINKINPFNYTSYKDEILLYSDLIFDNLSKIKRIFNYQFPGYDSIDYLHYIDIKIFKRTQSLIISTKDKNGNFLFDDYYITNLALITITRFDINAYDEIYIDGNGSFSFFNKIKRQNLLLNNEGIKDKIKGVFIMGGVLAGVKPFTMSKINGVIHRLAVSTMNQLYHPQAFNNFLEFIQQTAAKDNIYFLSNHSILQDSELVNSIKNSDIYKISLLIELCDIYYKKGQKKPFDLFTSRALVLFMKGQLEIAQEQSYLTYNNDYGISLLSNKHYSIYDDYQPYYLDNQKQTFFSDLPVIQEDIKNNFNFMDKLYYTYPCKILTIKGYISKFIETRINNKTQEYNYDKLITDTEIPIIYDYSELLKLYNETLLIKGGGRKKKTIKRLKTYS